jgi:hypothetical protein
VTAPLYYAVDPSTGLRLREATAREQYAYTAASLRRHRDPRMLHAHPIGGVLIVCCEGPGLPAYSQGVSD